MPPYQHFLIVVSTFLIVLGTDLPFTQSSLVRGRKVKLEAETNFNGSARALGFLDTEAEIAGRPGTHRVMRVDKIVYAIYCYHWHDLYYCMLKYSHQNDY